MGYNLKPAYSSVDEMQTKDRGISIMYGRTPDALGGDIVPVKVDASGSIVIGSGISLSGTLDALSKGIYDPSFVDPSPSAGAAIIGVKRVGDLSAVDANLYSALVQDPRLTFTGGSLNVTTSSGAVDHIFPVQNVTINAATYTTFSGTGVTPFETRGYASKSFTVKNTGAVQVHVRAFVSMDDTTYDVPILSDSILLPGASVWVDDARAFTGCQFQFQRDPGGDTTVQLKGYVQ